MQQYFYSSAKHLLVLQVRDTYSFAGLSFSVNACETWYFLAIHRCAFWVLFNLKYIFVSLYKYNS